MATVRFHHADEFLAELALDTDQIERKIVRTTYRNDYQQPFTAVSVVASAIVAGHVVTLEQRCGNYMNRDDTDGKEVLDRADKVIEEVRRGAAKLGMEVRAGVFVAAA